MEEQKTEQAEVVETAEKPQPSEQELMKACNDELALLLKKHGFMLDVRLAIDPAAEILRPIIRERVEGIIALMRPPKEG